MIQGYLKNVARVFYNNINPKKSAIHTYHRLSRNFSCNAKLSEIHKGAEDRIKNQSKFLKRDSNIM